MAYVITVDDVVYLRVYYLFQIFHIISIKTVVFKMNLRLNLKLALAFVCLVIVPQIVFTEGNNRGSLIVVDNENTDVEIDDENLTPISDEVFNPTNEWQEIKPGQTIPKGLYVRINLQTGLKEAKLMENEAHAGDPNYLKHLKDITKDRRKKFRSLYELKKDLDDMKVNLRSDYEIMKTLVTELKSESLSDDQKINIYNDLEYYLHQFDNGQDFVKMKGIELILPDFNSTNEKFRAMSAFVLGSAMQSNPKVQIAALESGLLQVLLRLIVFDSSHLARGHGLYALSCLIRHFPLAQQKFLEHGGLVALSKLFEPKLNQPKDFKLQIKVITLITDLMEEQLLSAQQHGPQTDQHLEEKKRQYNRIQLKLNLLEQGWCYHIPRPLVVPEHDGREKVMKAMILLAENCRSEFTKSYSILKTIHLEYKKLSVDEASDNTDSNDKYFTHLKEMVEVLLQGLSDNKDEL